MEGLLSTRPTPSSLVCKLSVKKAKLLSSMTSISSGNQDKQKMVSQEVWNVTATATAAATAQITLLQFQTWWRTQVDSTVLSIWRRIQVPISGETKRAKRGIIYIYIYIYIHIESRWYEIKESTPKIYLLLRIYNCENISELFSRIHI